MKIIPFFKSHKNNSEFQNLFTQVENLLNLARTLFTQSDEVKKVISSEKAAVEKSSAAAHEIASMVETTATAAQELSKTAKQSNTSVEGAIDSLQSLTQAIGHVDVTSRRLQTSVANGLKEISTVTRTMQEIREKAKVINEIVFQTKLLSFNASVEAARAGEHGKGFAVVAEEMGNLARASGTAAKEIEEILITSVDRTNSQIQQVTKDLETIASETVRSISSVSTKSSEISNSFSNLSEYSKNTEYQSQEISRATKEQEIGVREILHSLQDLENSSRNLDKMAAESHQSSAHLASSVEAIDQQFVSLAKLLGYKVERAQTVFDFKAAISAHVDWKMKLSRYLHNPDGSLDHKKVCMDNACMLGKWLYNEGAEYKRTEHQTYEALRQSHAEFHKTAGQIISLINNRQKPEAEKLLAVGGPYMQVSESTIQLIQQLQNAVEGNHSHQFRKSA